MPRWGRRGRWARPSVGARGTPATPRPPTASRACAKPAKAPPRATAQNAPLPPAPRPAMPHGDVVVQVFGKPDAGRTREHNEDAFVVADLTTGNATLQPEVRTHTVGPRGSLFMVADGMGGAAAGEIASAMAVEVVVRDMLTRWTQSTEHPSPELFAASLRS